MVQNDIIAYSAFKRNPQKTVFPAIVDSFASHSTLPTSITLLSTALNDAYPKIGDSLDEAYEEAKKLDSPEITIKSVDCVSCHISTPLRSLIQWRITQRDPDSASRFTPRGYLREPDQASHLFGSATTTRKSGVFADFFLAQRDVIEDNFSERDDPIATFLGYDPKSHSEVNEDNLIPRLDYIQRNGGYFGAYPMISQRTINESAADASFLNHVLSRESFTPNTLSPEIQLHQRDFLPFLTAKRQVELDQLAQLSLHPEWFKKAWKSSDLNVLHSEMMKNNELKKHVEAVIDQYPDHPINLERNSTFVYKYWIEGNSSFEFAVTNYRDRERPFALLNGYFNKWRSESIYSLPLIGNAEIIDLN